MPNNEPTDRVEVATPVMDNTTLPRITQDGYDIAAGIAHAEMLRLLADAQQRALGRSDGNGLATRHDVMAAANAKQSGLTRANARLSIGIGLIGISAGLLVALLVSDSPVNTAALVVALALGALGFALGGLGYGTMRAATD